MKESVHLQSSRKPKGKGEISWQDQSSEIPSTAFSFSVALFKSQIPVKGSSGSSLGLGPWLKENRASGYFTRPRNRM